MSTARREWATPWLEWDWSSGFWKGVPTGCHDWDTRFFLCDKALREWFHIPKGTQHVRMVFCNERVRNAYCAEYDNDDCAIKVYVGDKRHHVPILYQLLCLLWENAPRDQPFWFWLEVR